MLPYIDVFGMRLPMYGICLVTGIAVVILLMTRKCKKEQLIWEDALVIVFSGIGFGFLGAKIVFLCVTYSFDEILQIIVFGNVELLVESGFVFFGGLIFGTIGAFVGAKIAKAQLFDYERVLVPLIPLAHAFGRIGCLFAGCCYGKVTESGLGVVYKNPISDAPLDISLIPIQAYEALLNLILFFVLNAFSKRLKKGKLLCAYLVLYSVVRFFVEFWRYDAVRGKFGDFSTSQWISIGVVIVCMCIFIKRSCPKYSNNKK